MAKILISKIKSQMTAWGKITGSHVRDKGPIPLIYKYLINIKQKTKNLVIKKKVVKKQKSQTVKELSERMLDCSGLVSVICIYLIRKRHRVDFVHVEDSIFPRLQTDPRILTPEIKIELMLCGPTEIFIFSHIYKISGYQAHALKYSSCNEEN